MRWAIPKPASATAANFPSSSNLLLRGEPGSPLLLPLHLILFGCARSPNPSRDRGTLWVRSACLPQSQPTLPHGRGSESSFPLTLSSPYIPLMPIGSMLRNQCSSGCVSLTPFCISNICKKLLAIHERFTILWVVAGNGMVWG